MAACPFSQAPPHPFSLSPFLSSSLWWLRLWPIGWQLVKAWRPPAAFRSQSTCLATATLGKLLINLQFSHLRKGELIMAATRCGTTRRLLHAMMKVDLNSSWLHKYKVTSTAHLKACHCSGSGSELQVCKGPDSNISSPAGPKSLSQPVYPAGAAQEQPEATNGQSYVPIKPYS